MSMRQPPSKAEATTTVATEIGRRGSILARHLRHRARSKAFQKLSRLAWIVFLVGRKHDQEKTVLRSQRKSRHIKYRMIRHGQPVQCQHAEYGRDSREQNCHLACNADQCRPRMRRFSTNVEWIVDRR